MFTLKLNWKTSPLCAANKTSHASFEILFFERFCIINIIIIIIGFSSSFRLILFACVSSSVVFIRRCLCLPAPQLQTTHTHSNFYVNVDLNTKRKGDTNIQPSERYTKVYTHQKKSKPTAVHHPHCNNNNKWQ